MRGVTSRHSNTWGILSRRGAHTGSATLTAMFLFAALVPLVPWAFAQSNSPRVASVDPVSGKVNDTVTVTGTNLGKGSVVAVFLSDDKNDYKATLVNQDAEKLVIKIPQVKAGSYNLSVQAGAQILILPVHFTVE